MEPNYKQLLEKYMKYIDTIRSDSDKGKMNRNYCMLCKLYMNHIRQEDHTDHVYNINKKTLSKLPFMRKYDKNFTKEEQKMLEELSDFIHQIQIHYY